MKLRTLITALTLGVSAWVVTAQQADPPPQEDGRPLRRERPERPPRRERPERPALGETQRPVVPPLFAAFDANQDGVIDETEINNAVAALKTLDKDGDGKVTRAEIRPDRPMGPRGARAQMGPRDQRGPRAQAGPRHQRGPRSPGGLPPGRGFGGPRGPRGPQAERPLPPPDVEQE